MWHNDRWTPPSLRFLHLFGGLGGDFGDNTLKQTLQKEKKLTYLLSFDPCPAPLRICYYPYCRSAVSTVFNTLCDSKIVWCSGIVCVSETIVSTFARGSCSDY